MENKTLYISDLDGTLLNIEAEISKYTKDILNTCIEKGMYFTIATARTAASTVKILSGLNLNLPIILMNGAAIYNIQDHSYIKTEAIVEKTANIILDIFKMHDISGFMYAIPNDELITYYENLDTEALQNCYKERVMKYNKTFEQVDSLFTKTKNNNIVYFSLIDEYERLSMVLNDLKDQPDIDIVLYRDIYTEDLWYLEIHSIKASKYNAVRYIRELYNFEQIIGFGDNINDLPLFEACDECFAVSNAVSELKEKATGIITDHNLDGVARFIFERES